MSQLLQVVPSMHSFRFEDPSLTHVLGIYRLPTYIPHLLMEFYRISGWITKDIDLIR